jgi:HD-like signal output (HDOD) protein
MPSSMLRLLLFLIIAVAAFLIIRSLFRGGAPRTRAEPRSRPRIEPPPKALPAPHHTENILNADQIFAKLYALALGVPELSLVPPPAHKAIVDGATAALETAATEPRYAPRRPMLLPQLLRAVNDSEVSRREISTIIARDPALAGNLLKLANSSFYRVNAQPVESVDRAVALLGTEGIRSLIAAALVQPVFLASGSEYVQFAEIAWEHTVRMSAAAESHAAVVENADPFAAQLLGLILGLATLIVFRVALDQFQAQGQRPNPGVMGHLLDRHTASVARKIASSWDLSGRVLSALEDQLPGDAMSEPTALGRSLRFGRLLGALAVLNSKDQVDDETARASMLAAGASAPQFDRFWTRLTGRPTADEQKRHRPPSSLAG